jgi:hypothetical protein
MTSGDTRRLKPLPTTPKTGQSLTQREWVENASTWLLRGLLGQIPLPMAASAAIPLLAKVERSDALEQGHSA